MHTYSNQLYVHLKNMLTKDVLMLLIRAPQHKFLEDNNDISFAIIHDLNI